MNTELDSLLDNHSVVKIKVTIVVFINYKVYTKYLPVSVKFDARF